MALKYPWTIQDYFKFIKHGSNEIKNNYYCKRDIIHVQNLTFDPDVIGGSTIYFDKPVLLKKDSEKFVHDNIVYGATDIHIDMVYIAYDVICFKNTFHTYSYETGENKTFFDATETIWNYVCQNDIDYTNMTVEDFNLIKLYYSSIV